MTKRLTIALIALVALVLVAVLPVSATYYQVNNTIFAQGATVYIGEQQLNLTPALVQYYAGAVPATVQLGWWASAADLGTTAPSQTITVSNPNSFYVSPSWAAYAGNWYTLPYAVGNPAFLSVQAPSISAVDIYDLNTGVVVTGQSVIQGDQLAIRINSNLDQALNPAFRQNLNATNSALVGLWPGVYNDTGNLTAAPGNFDIKVKSSTGNTYTALYTGAAGFATQTITQQNVNSQSWFWGTSDGQTPSTSNAAPNWSTGAADPSGQPAYPAGVYTIIAQSRLNGMYDNYLNGGATYTGATISQPATVTLVSNTVALSANVNTVVRSKPFSVTITGKPNAVYHLWVKGTNAMSGMYNSQPPYITPNQAGVIQDNSTTGPVANLGPFTPSIDNGNYYIENGGGNYFQVPQAAGRTVVGDVAPSDKQFVPYAATAGDIALGNGTYVYANVTLDQTGTRTVQFSTTNWTKAQQYTIRVEQDFASPIGYKYDEVNVQVQQGAVTIVAAGSQSYYLGEEVQFSGTDTESSDVYLYITGPNLPTQGTSMSATDPRNYQAYANAPLGVVNGIAADGFQDISVNGDNTWSWEWGTANVPLDAGTYTVYAVSGPYDANDLQNVVYGTVSIIVKAPFVSATASQSTVAQGDAVYITGTAEGQPSAGVNIWILGKNYANMQNEAVNSDSSFSYELMGTDTQKMAAGQYFIVVQHPMENDAFDVYAGNNFGVPTSTVYGTSGVYVWTTGSVAPSQDFQLTGAGSLQGSNAAEALVQAINSPNVDDTYTKLQMLIETPVITINPVGDHNVGDKFTITASTNLAVGDNVLFTVYSSSFQPTDKTQSGEFSGASGTVQVTQGTNGLNALSFDVDASTFKPDEYLITATEQGVSTSVQATGTALFNVLQASAPTATPTPVANVTTAAPTTMPPTEVPTTVAPTKTPTQPGFGALVALIGLGAVALLVVRRH